VTIPTAICANNATPTAAIVHARGRRSQLTVTRRTHVPDMNPVRTLAGRRESIITTVTREDPP
jgi:hypothetical protein